MSSFTTFARWFKRPLYTAIASFGLFGSGAGLLAQDAPTIVAEGTRVTLTATADGTPAPTFAWLKNGAPLEGVTDAVLVIAAAGLSDAAKYTVIASNSAGSALSPEVELIVQAAAVAPVITAGPESVIGLPGVTVVFSVSATGTPAPTYQWLKNGVAVDGWTSAALTLSSLTSNDVATYQVVVSNAAGSVTSATAQLTLQEPVVVASAPVITSEPFSVVGTLGGAGSFSVSASGVPVPTFQWFKNGALLAGAMSEVLNFSALAASDVGSYQVVATNSAGSVTSAAAQLTLQEPVVVASAPVITRQPVSVVAMVGATASFSVSASGVPVPTFQWFKNGVLLTGATSEVLSFSALAAVAAGSYQVVVTNAVGSVTSTSVTLAVQMAPVFTTQPVSQTVNSGSNVRLTAVVEGSPQPTLQWRKNGLPIAGATLLSLKLFSVNLADGGSYTLVATNSEGTTISREAILTVASTSKNPSSGSPKKGGASATEFGLIASAPTYLGNDDSSRVVNFSVRALAGAGAHSLILGFVLSEDAQTPVLLRGVGPTLAQFGVVNALADPQVALYSGTSLLAANDDWAADIAAADLRTRAAQLGAYALGESSLDAALSANLGGGNYTAQLWGQTGKNGIASVELYAGGENARGRLINGSVRVRVESGGDVPQIGFVIEGGQPKKVLIRAVGPALGRLGVPEALSDPQLELFAGSTRLQHNDDWSGSAVLRETFARVGAFALDEKSKDAALIATLEPGVYTAFVSGLGGSTGSVLVELYEVP